MSKPAAMTDGVRADKPGLHPRNRHRQRYDFGRLAASCPELAAFVAINAHGDDSIDFADPVAVKALNRAILNADYGVACWDIPPGYLCPPIPGRVDYLHHLADLLAADQGGEMPRGDSVRVLDVGVGANCIYPLLGRHEYGWHFVGADIDRVALASAQKIIDANGLADAIELRLQQSPASCLKGVPRAGEVFDAVICNPPFHASLADATAGTQRKWGNLGKAKTPALNFGGQGAELCCPGGEREFVRRLIADSARLPKRCRWFTALVSKAANLPALQAALSRAGVAEQRTIDMAQGQKKSRIVAWSFLDAGERAALSARNARPPK